MIGRDGEREMTAKRRGYGGGGRGGTRHTARRSGGGRLSRTAVTAERSKLVGEGRGM